MYRPFADSFAQSYIHGGSACATSRFAFRRPCQKKEGQVIHSIMHLHTYLRLRVVARVCAAIPTFRGSYERCWNHQNLSIIDFRQQQIHGCHEGMQSRAPTIVPTACLIFVDVALHAPLAIAEPLHPKCQGYPLLLSSR